MLKKMCVNLDATSSTRKKTRLGEICLYLALLKLLQTNLLHLILRDVRSPEFSGGCHGSGKMLKKKFKPRLGGEIYEKGGRWCSV
jgi:hypothetical protein